MAADRILLPGRPEVALVRDNEDDTDGLNLASFTENASCVAQVAFLASIPSSHLLSYEDFADSVKQKAKSHYGQNSTEMKFPNLEAEYERHMQQMRGVEKDKLVPAWVAALDKIGNQTTIETMPYSPEFQITAQPKGGDTRETFKLTVYDDAIVLNEAGDELFQKVITTLAHVESPPERLLLHHNSSGCMKWRKDSTKIDVVLKSLKYLEFGVTHSTPLNGNVDKDALDDLFTQLQSGCREHLESLSICALLGPCRFGFPHEPNLIRMSSLTELRLQFCTIHVSNLAKFIGLQKCLQNLSMSHTDFYENTGSWQEVWDAIRNHGKCLTLHLSFCVVFCGLDNYVTMEYSAVTEDGQKGLRSYSAELTSDKTNKLVGYLDGEQQWCTELGD